MGGCGHARLGRIGIRTERGEDRLCDLTRDEQITLLTLRLISRSPLMMGGDLPTSPPETIEPLTDDEALDVLRHSEDNREVMREKDRDSPRRRVGPSAE